MSIRELQFGMLQYRRAMFVTDDHPISFVMMILNRINTINLPYIYSNMFFL